MVVVVVALLFYVHSKHLRSCWDGLIAWISQGKDITGQAN